ncbi:MAG TPA: flagellar motor protein MotB [Thermodesulfobacteriota bacterium]|jgi:chemotaxis protein MotB|nr:flagellar motor protein MotB [Thermodesulfobacteriota bacterium]
MKEEKPIVKRVKKGGHRDDHGGSWKVAYADFITAMMALFLCLWLINMVAPEKRAKVAHYFKHFSVFDHSGASFMEKTSEVFNETGDAEERVPDELEAPDTMKPLIRNERGQMERGSPNELKGGFDPSKEEIDHRKEEIKEEIKRAIEEKLADIKDQVIVDTFEGGIRIQLVDKEGKPMFELGSSKPTPMAQRILRVISDEVKSLPNSVAIEGHTDSLPYRSTNYSNWDLSTERALSAKRQLEEYGLNTNRLIKIAGYADTVPLIKENPEDPRNRRISILLILLKEESTKTAER